MVLHVGVAGKSCAGKDFVCQILAQYGYREVAVDAIGHVVLEQKWDEVLAAFPQIAEGCAANRSSTAAESRLKNPFLRLCPSPNERMHNQLDNQQQRQKKINRKKLADLVFRNPAALHKLEQILHPQIRELVVQQLKDAEQGEKNRQSHHIVVNAAILEKLQLLCYCDLLLWVQAPIWLRAWRARQRDQSSTWQFCQREWAQRNLAPPKGPQFAPVYRRVSGTQEFTGTKVCAVYLLKNHFLCKQQALRELRRQLQSIPQLW